MNTYLDFCGVNRRLESNHKGNLTVNEIDRFVNYNVLLICTRDYYDICFNDDMLT